MNNVPWGALCALVILALLGWMVIRNTRAPRGEKYFYNANNPYRRICAACGQNQTRYAFSANEWKTDGPINNHKCVCHEDAEGSA